MANYALILNGFVENIVVWDGFGDIFDEYTVVEYESGTAISPGSKAELVKGKWVFTPPEPIGV